MARPSRDPQSGATIHEMAPESRTQYEHFKVAGVKGWSRRCDPWAWSNSTASDPWPARDSSNPGIWPPAVEAS